MTAADVASVQSLEDNRTQTMVRGDWDALAAMLGEDMIYGHSGGTVDTKASMLALLRSGKLVYREIAPQIDSATQIVPGIVVATGMLRTVAEIGGAEKRLYGRYLCVWQQQPSGWLLQALQGTDSGS